MSKRRVSPEDIERCTEIFAKAKVRRDDRGTAHLNDYITTEQSKLELNARVKPNLHASKLVQ